MVDGFPDPAGEGADDSFDRWLHSGRSGRDAAGPPPSSLVSWVDSVTSDRHHAWPDEVAPTPELDPEHGRAALGDPDYVARPRYRTEPSYRDRPSFPATRPPSAITDALYADAPFAFRVDPTPPADTFSSTDTSYPTDDTSYPTAMFDPVDLRRDEETRLERSRDRSSERRRDQPRDARRTPPPPRPQRTGPDSRGARNRWLMPAIAVALLPWAASGYVNVVHPLPVAAAASSPALAAVAVPMAVAALRSRRFLTAALATVVALIPWVMIVGYASPGPSPDLGADTTTLRVMTVNARLGQADAAQIVQAARDQAADVLVITELSTTLSHDLTVAGIDTVLAPRWVDLSPQHGAVGGIGLYARFPLENPRAVAGTAWPAGSGVLQTPGGPVTVTAAHVSQPLPTGTTRWASDLAVLAALPAAPGPQILVGDLNSTPWNAPYRRLTVAGWTDAADIVGRGMRPTWPRWSPLALAPLDHVMVRGAVDAEQVGTVSIAGTDHDALIVTLVAGRG